MHLNGLYSNVTIKEIYTKDVETNKLKKKVFAKSKDKVSFDIISDTFLLTAKYDSLKKVILRSGSSTIAVGTVVKYRV